MTTRKDETKEKIPDVTVFLDALLDNEGEEETVVNLLAPADGQGFAYATADGGVALVISKNGECCTEIMTAEQARLLGSQLINAADVDDENW